MQCPTCGNDTPGTLGKCSHCEAPIDVYSVGPVVPLSAPPATGAADAPPTGNAAAAGNAAAGPSGPLSGPLPGPLSGSADALGDRTVMVPPPTPSWAGNDRPPVLPDLSMPSPPAQQTAPEPPAAQQTAPEPPAGEMPPASARPPLQLSVEPSTPPAQPPVQPPVQPPAQPPAAASPTPTPPGSPIPPFDPEDTAAWTFNPDEDDETSGGFSAPMNAAAPPPAPADAAPNPFGLEPLPERRESIVPESWFAQPRRPDVAEAGATQMLGQQPAPGPGPGGNLDQTRMDPGAPMGMAPMGQAPMGQEPMALPMGQGGGLGDPAYGGHPAGPGAPMGQGRPGGGPSKPLIAAVAALVTVAVGAVVFVVWPSGDDSSASTDPSPTASNRQVAQKNPIPAATKEQAEAMNAVLNDSVGTRRVLAGALGRAGKCKTLPQAIQGFQTVAQHRQNQLNRTRNLKVDKLANGERLRTSLAQALTASLQVDQVLLRWAQANQRGCRGKPKPSAAQVPGRAAGERRATSAKKRFVVLWNPVAKKTGQPQRSWKRV